MEKKKKKILYTALLTGAFITTTATFSKLSLPHHEFIDLFYNLQNSNLVSYKTPSIYEWFLSNDYEPYLDSIINQDISVPLIDNYVPQGLTLIDDYLLISCYDYHGNDNSIIWVIDKDDNIINKCNLYNKAHVGGLCYDEKNNFLWVASNNGCLDIYNPQDIITKEQAIPIYKNIDSTTALNEKDKESHSSISYLTIFNNCLYVGDFKVLHQGLVKKFTIDTQNNKPSLKLEDTFLVPSKVQGITFYKRSKETYLLLSRSYTTYVPSVIQIYKYHPNINNYSYQKSISYKVPSMLEQITIFQNKLYAIFESGASVYSNSTKDTLEEICISEPRLLLEPFAKKEKQP